MDCSGREGLYVLLTTTDDLDQPVVPRILVWVPSSLSFPQKISLHCSSNMFYFPFIKYYTKVLPIIHSLLMMKCNPRSPDVAPNFAYH